ncbi:MULTISPECIES: SGNH/GDSL hydrolase family protein [unclassified Paenibacillus]|uniref:SGNH/GDSL hydrolase family protein n=1 Tax=unclassified Paenibacillus TaxID=185978 RepID=UPI002405AA89|nr:MULTISPECIES: SGNH/GDSL hydrolase family protein [unclassified Paenibacillus]MDF9841686.1 lysophospholipase L1-like esterase [Paenibacillus sp. PastF-2]MDF9848202.1 lysophospholipase L1-like esterase [Paenibacillus sp. PastM-2]MDF9854845.1 lysophospholipase L1-like esterase [Paenibacillus sp. PastF-1]MDH6480115.1 lysophospholipase L1-like esterase [Paenibacillus sp. PastH-2]MDH6507546.1 lysophospholipase L1-like esterase [Paenibacillus sp. PastM-3]
MKESIQVYRATENHVKIIGRTHYYKDVRWLALSGSGVAFTFYGRKAEITLKGDSIASTGNNLARIGIYVNGVRVIDEQINQPLVTYTVFESDTEQEITVTVIKLSEAAMSTAGIQAIRVDAAEGIKPAPAGIYKIEFIGDSITCGYGVDDEAGTQAFSTATEDVTKAYAYQTARKLEADYSMVSYSGYGIITGYTENDQKLTTHLLPDYYEQVGKSEGRFDNTLLPQELTWDFSRFVPDLIVINLGTNDDSYTKDDTVRQAEYAREYAGFLETVRRCNPHAKILCTLGIMGDRLYPYVEQAVSRYTEETGDTNISSMKFDVQQAADGYASDFHPSPVTHHKAAGKLADRIKELMQRE